MSNESESKRIDLTQFEGVMNVDWLFEEQLIVGKGEWRFALNEYSDLADMSAKDIEEWEEGLEPVWDSLTNGIAMLPDLIAELKKCYEELDTFYPLHGLEVWDEDPDYSRAEWREEVAEGHVTSGYWRWVSNQYLASE